MVQQATKDSLNAALKKKEDEKLAEEANLDSTFGRHSYKW